jgi:cysteine/glycine-rich protein
MDLHSDPDLLKLITRNQPVVRTSAPICPKCNKNVYKAEETRAASQTFHKLCFKCTSCSRPLESNILTEHQGDLFCKSCYAKNFGPRGYGYGSNTLSMDNNSFNSLTNGGANGSLNSSNENGTM